MTATTTSTAKLPKVDIDRFLRDPERYLAEVELGTHLRITRLGFTVAVLVPQDSYQDPAEVAEDKFDEIEGAIADISADIASLRRDFGRWRDEAAKKK